MIIKLKKPKNVSYNLYQYPCKVNNEIVSMDIDKKRTAEYIKTVLDGNGTMTDEQIKEYTEFAKKLNPKINL